MPAHLGDPSLPSAKQLIDDFVESAVEYCSLLEGHRQYPLGDFLERVRELLPVLYYRALRLPDVTSTHNRTYRDITHEQWREMFDRLREYLGRHDQYWLIFDPVKKDVADPNLCNLSDDLADIWRDLKNGLLHWDGGPGSSEIVWQWRFHFHGHWSDHMAAALRTINWLIEDYDVAETNKDS